MWELGVLEWFDSLHGSMLDPVMVGMTYSATSGLIWFVLGFLMTCSRRWRGCGASIVISVALAYIVVDVILKPLVCRERPFAAEDFDLLIPAPDTWSFPSGHTASAFAGAQETGSRSPGICGSGGDLEDVSLRPLAHRRHRRCGDRGPGGGTRRMVRVQIRAVVPGPRKGVPGFGSRIRLRSTGGCPRPIQPGDPESHGRGSQAGIRGRQEEIRFRGRAVQGSGIPIAISGGIHSSTKLHCSLTKVMVLSTFSLHLCRAACGSENLMQEAATERLMWLPISAIASAS